MTSQYFKATSAMQSSILCNTQLQVIIRYQINPLPLFQSPTQKQPVQLCYLSQGKDKAVQGIVIRWYSGNDFRSIFNIQLAIKIRQSVTKIRYLFRGYLSIFYNRLWNFYGFKAIRKSTFLSPRIILTEVCFIRVYKI